MTAGYTPTISQIRRGYRAAWGPTNVATRPEVDGIADKAFDRGIAAHDAEMAVRAKAHVLLDLAEEFGTWGPTAFTLRARAMALLTGDQS